MIGQNSPVMVWNLITNQTWGYGSVAALLGGQSAFTFAPFPPGVYRVVNSTNTSFQVAVNGSSYVVSPGGDWTFYPTPSFGGFQGQSGVFIGGAAAAAPGTLSAAINAEDWTADVTFASFKVGGTLTLNPITTPTLTFNVVSQGFDISGNPTTFSRAVVGTIAKRQPWPTETQRVEVAVGNATKITVALSDVIMASDAVTLTALSGVLVDNGTGGSGSSSLAISNGAVINSSVFAGHKPIVAWVTPPCQRATGTTFIVELAVAHRHGQAGKMVQAVKFIATGQTSLAQVTITASTMSASAVATKISSQKVPVYSASIPLASFTQGELVLVDAIVCPFFGPSLQVSVDGGAFPSVNLTQLRFVCDRLGTYSGATAHVASTGNDGTGVVNNAGQPYLTIGAALAAIQAYHNTHNGRNNIDGGTVLLGNQTYASFGPTSVSGLTWGRNAWCQIGLDSGATKAGVIYNLTDQTNTLIPINGGLFWSGMTIRNLAAAAPGWQGNNTNQMMWFDGCDLVGDNSDAASFYQCGYLYFTNCLIQQIRGALTPFSNTSDAAALVVSCDCDTCGDQAHLLYTALGNRYHGLYATGNTVCVPNCPPVIGLTVGNGGAVPIPLQSFMMSCICNGMVNNTQAVMPWYVGGNTNVGLSPTMGVAFVQNVIERLDNPEVSPAVFLCGDGDGVQCDNAVVVYNTVTGARINAQYLDFNNINVSKTGIQRFNAWANYNVKRDTFNSPIGGNNAARVNNWSWSHFVGSTGNANQLPSIGQNTSLTPGPDWWGGEYFAVMANNCGGFTAGNPGSVTILNPYQYTTNAGSAAYGGSGAGNGNYLPSSNTSRLRALVASGTSMLPIDIAGSARRNDGTGYAGAYEGPP